MLLFIASAGGLLPHSALPNTPASPVPQTDKFLHLVTFFGLTASFYFVFDTTRRRILHITLFVCTFALAVGSEIVQGLLPNGRDFDPLDVIANVLGSLSALGLATFYHKRALERRRRARFNTVLDDGLPEGDEDLELGHSTVRQGDVGNEAVSDERSNVVSSEPRTIEEELDHWDENASDDVIDGDDETLDGSKKAAKST